LVLVCLFRTATYYCADIPSTMQGAIMKDYGVNSTQYGLITAMISVPAIFTSFFTGILVDKLGSMRLMMPLILLVSLGMAIQTSSAYLKDFNLLLIGRFVFALGYESINVLKGIIVNDWFLGAELSTANSINLSFVRGIVFVSGAFTPLIH
jgi:MFS family permease